MKKKPGKLHQFPTKKEIVPKDLGALGLELKPLTIPSEKAILDQMKASGHPMLAEFADALEREKRGEKVDFRKFSDL